MNKVNDILLPPRMRAGLAQGLAELLSWTPQDEELVNFTALSLMHASWQMQTPFILSDLLTFLREKVFSSNIEETGARLFSMDLYAMAGMVHGVGPVAMVQAQQSAMYWSGKLRNADLERLQSYLDAGLQAILDDDSARTTNLAEEMDLLVMNWHPEAEPVADGSSEPKPKADATPPPPPPPLMLAGAPRTILIGPGGQPIGAIAGMPAEAMAMLLQQLGMRQHPTGEGAAEASKPKAEKTSDEPRGPGVQVFLPEEAISLLQRLPPPAPAEGNAQQRRLLEVMANDDGWRPLSLVPDGNPLAELYESFPHFKEVLDFIAKSLALAGCGEEGRPVWIPPILLRSKPGLGKTFFAQELARVLGTHFVERDLSVTSEAFVLTGMAANWKNSQSGVVFNSIVNAKTANPVICLNEVDKCSHQGSHNSPISALYALLEPTSANQFIDEFVTLPIDASRVVWVLTANDGEIPDPVLSRLEVFDLPEPTPEQSRAIAASVWRSLCRRTLPRGHGFAEELGDTLLPAVSKMSPRVMRKALTHAASTAALAQRKYMTLDDLSESQKRYQTVTRRPIGF